MWKKVFVKFINWLRSYWALNFVFFAILLQFLEIWWFLECHIFAIKWDFQKRFSHLRSSLSILTKKQIANLSWQKMKLSYFLLPVLWRHFRAKTRQHQKIQKHTTVWNRNLFYYHAKIQLKRLTSENLVERDDFLMTADPPCSVSSAWAFSREFKQDASLAS